MIGLSLVIGTWLLAMAQVASAESVGARERCQSAKLRAFGSYHLCASRTEAQAVRQGTTFDLSHCSGAFLTELAARGAQRGRLVPDDE
jgi:hypothetical protein